MASKASKFLLFFSDEEEDNILESPFYHTGNKTQLPPHHIVSDLGTENPTITALPTLGRFGIALTVPIGTAPAACFIPPCGTEVSIGETFNAFIMEINPWFTSPVHSKVFESPNHSKTFTGVGDEIPSQAKNKVFGSTTHNKTFISPERDLNQEF